MPEFTLAAPADEKELAAALDIIALSLHFPRELADRFANVSGAQNFRVLRSTERRASGSKTAIIGGLVIHPMGQFFGGRSVSMGGIGAVGIAPEHRAGGAATAMMNLAVGDMHERNIALSTLYPATVTLYRRAGYELAGSRYEITIPLRQMRLPSNAASNDRELTVERIDDDDRAAVEALYMDQARAGGSGALERGVFSWKRVYQPRGEPARGYKIINAQGEMEGFVMLLQKDESPLTSAKSANPPMFYLLVNEVQLRTPRAGLRILELLRQHRSVCADATLYGSPDHPLLALIPERTFTATHQFHWMTRIVDVRKALAERGWNPCISSEVHLDVRDELIGANNQRFVLRIHDGAASIEHGGSGDCIIDIRGLAPLYTGHLPPNDLLNWGHLRIADHVRDPHHALRVLGGIFAGPRPWMADMF